MKEEEREPNWFKRCVCGAILAVARYDPAGEPPEGSLREF